MNTSRSVVYVTSLVALGLVLGCEEDSSSGSSEPDAGEQTQEGDDSDDGTSGSTDTTSGETDTEEGADTDPDDTDDSESTDTPPTGDAGSTDDPDDESPDAGPADPDPDSGAEDSDPSTDVPGTDPETDTPDETDTTEETETDETDDPNTTDLPEIVTSKIAYFSLTQFTQEVSAGGNTISITGAGFSAGFVQYEARVDPDFEPQEPEDRCETVIVGACTSRVCLPPEESEEEEENQEPAPESPVLTTTELLPASVTVTGLLVDPLEVPRATLEESLGAPPEVSEPISAIFGYNVSAIPGSYWVGGETARIQVGASAEVPAFDISFQPPSVVAWTAPTSVSTSAGLELSWTNGGAGDAYVTLGGSTADDVTHSILCTVPTSAGGVSVDASLLDGLEGSGALTLQTMITLTGTQGDFSYSVIGQNAGPARFVTFAP